MIGKIKNIECYNERMDKSLFDKIWFIDKVDAEVFVDFGCANGNLIIFLSKLFPNNIFIGYDISKEMIDIANSSNDNRNVYFTNKWDIITNILSKYKDKKTCLILSSVMHEIYSYGTIQSVDKFWKDIETVDFDYIAIRDMIGELNGNFFSNSLSIKMIEDYRQDMICEIKSKYPKQVKDFERYFGTIVTFKSIIHFLLKYKYIENWDREVKENYLPITPQLIKFNLGNYQEIYQDRYCLHYLNKQFKKDFTNYKSDTFHTHYKLLLEKYEK